VGRVFSIKDGEASESLYADKKNLDSYLTAYIKFQMDHRLNAIDKVTNYFHNTLRRISS
jgi:hypothetical protein